jgi:hypothetical protein
MAATNVQAFSGDVELNDRLTINSSVGNITKKSFTSYSASGYTRYWKVASGNYDGDGNQRNHIKMTVNIHRIDTTNSTRRLVMEADAGSLIFHPCIDEHDTRNSNYPRDLRVYKNTSDTTFDIYIQVSSYSYVDVEMMYSGNSITVYDTPTWETAEPTTSGTYLLEFTNGNLNAMKIDNDGNVGIGMTDLTSKLNVASTFDPASATDSATFDKYTSVITNTIAGPSEDADNTEMGIAFANFGGSVFPNNVRTPGAAITHERVDSWSKGKLHFKTKGNTNFDGTCATRMTIDENGRVGIGITDPGVSLDVSGTIRGTSGILETAGSTTWTISNTGTPAVLRSLTTAGQAYIQTGTTTALDSRADLSFTSMYAGTHYIKIKGSTGNVGIGTTDPQQKLEVHGNILLGRNNVNSFIHGGSDMAVSADNHVLIVSDSNDTGGTASADIILGAGSAVDMDPNRDFTFAQAYPSSAPRLEHMRIMGSTGNVGIGTNNPQTNFEVYGNSWFNVDVSDSTYVKVGNRFSSSDVLVLHSVGDVVIASDSNNNSTGKNIDFRTNSDANGGNLLMRLSDNSRVGIGTSSPSTKLHVNPEILVTNADNGTAIISARGTSQGTGRLFVGQAADFGGGIEYNGDNSPASTGAGSDYITLYRAQASSLYWTAKNRYDTNTWEFRNTITNSDDRVKENETYIRDATDTLMKIKPQLYDKKPSIESTDTKEWFCEAGLIAQELYYDVPELRHLVKIPRDARDIDANVSITSADPTIDPDYSAWGKDTSAVNYVGLVPYLIKSVQEITTELPRHKTPVSNITPRNVNDFVGLIVSKRGSVELSSKSEDKACYGVISETTCDTQNNEILVNSSGEGKIWVTNVNGNLEAGDLITTSNIVGYGELQNSPVLSNFTVAKLTEDCDFNPPSTPVRRIRQEMSNVTVYSVTREVRVTEEEYNELAEEDRTTENRTTYFDGDNEIDFDGYSNSESNTLRTETTLVFKLIHRHTSRTMREGYTPEVRQELVNVLDEHGQIQWEDTNQTEKAYKIRYLDADGNITDEANAVHKAAFVGCTYHCG